jgi:IMP dehydrogenase
MYLVLFETTYSYDDVLLTPQRSLIKSRSQVDLKTHLSANLFLDIPIISANMDSVTGVCMAVSLGKLGGIGILPRFNSLKEEVEQLRIVKKEFVKVGASLGIKGDYLERAKVLIENGADCLVVDVAHGHMEKVLEVTQEIKLAFPKLTIISGNVATYEAAKDLFIAGADCVKVGIGPGSICTTRIETGHGVPQVTAILEASKAAKEFGKTIIADGGIKNSGDIVKALAAGANAVMLGNMLAGCDESPGEIFELNEIKYKKYFGSTSVEQKQKHLEKLQTDANYLKHIEGVSGSVLSIGPLSEIIEKLKAGIASGFSYSGAGNLKELHKKAKFIAITPAGFRESNSHDLLP